MPVISEYAKGRIKQTEKRMLLELISNTRKNKQLSAKFRKNIRVNMSAKYQTIYISVLNNKDLGKFEYDVLVPWADKYGISWEWGNERGNKQEIDLRF